MNRCPKLLFFFLLAVGLSCPGAHALEPEEVLVLANKNVRQSVSLARFYMGKRNIPKANLLLLSVTRNETCSRSEYEDDVVPQVRQYLEKYTGIRAIVTMFGLPLRISSPRKLSDEIETLRKYNEQKKAMEDRLAKEESARETSLNKDESKRDEKETKKEDSQLSQLKKTIAEYMRRIDKTASFDSELMLVKKESYNLNMWLPNPFYLGFQNHKMSISKPEVIMTSRLDAATPGIVERIIKDTLHAEKSGLKGKAYFDARWEHPGEKKVSGYTLYDKSIHEAARVLKVNKWIPVVLDEKSTLFQKGDSPDTALYCGWYSLAKYIDAFKWQKGSVGYHIASAECTTLKKEESRVWCKKMLDNGIAATIGPVGEPYVQAFPVPEIFFTYLAEGYLTLSESYLISLPFLSWKMVLIGDPLYRVNLKK